MDSFIPSSPEVSQDRLKGLLVPEIVRFDHLHDLGDDYQVIFVLI